MSNGWTPERRARQAELIRTWQPWKRSTGPRTPEGKARTSANAYRGAKRAESRGLMRALHELLKEQREAMFSLAG